MIEFKTNYSEDFEYYKSGDLVFYDEDNMELEMYGPDIEMLIQSPKMAEYMMDKAQELHLFLKDKWLADYPTSRAELDKILSILKDAGIEVEK